MWRRTTTLLLVLLLLNPSVPATAAGKFSPSFSAQYLSLSEDLGGRLSSLKTITEVNSYVNSFPYRSDPDQYGQEYTASATEFLTNGGGDCEDYVLAKAAILIRNKIAPLRDLRILIVHVPGSPSNHAVLAVKRNGRFLLLDNRYPFVIDPKEIPLEYELVDIIAFS